MDKIDWKRKFSSRKFYVCVAAFVVCVLKAFGFSESVIAEVVSIIMAAGSCVAYIIAEGWIDAAREKGKAETAEAEPEEPEYDTEGEGL